MYDSHYHDCHENFKIFVKTILTKKLWSVKPKISLCVSGILSDFLSISLNILAIPYVGELISETTGYVITI